MLARDLHYIQKAIIASLAQTSPQRFSQLQLPEVPNNTFSYHLKKLLQSGYIELGKTGYVATRKALKTLQYDTPDNKRADAPVLISALYITNDSGQVLLLRRNNRPFIGWYSVPSGLIHQGEHLEESAQRELLEKTTITATALHFAGVLDFRYLEQQSKDLFIHSVAFVYTYHIPGGGEQFANIQTRHGTLQWSDLKDEKVLPEVHTISEIARKREPTVESIDYDEPIVNL